jgi:hypothetical protein
LGGLNIDSKAFQIKQTNKHALFFYLVTLLQQIPVQCCND